MTRKYRILLSGVDWHFYSVWAVATIFGVVTGTTFWAILVLVAVSYVVCRFLYGLAPNASMPDVPGPTRTPLLETSWFQGSMAIADVVYVHGVGICSHQPDFRKRSLIGCYRMMNVDGNVYTVEDNKLLFLTTWEERREYWEHFKG